VPGILHGRIFPGIGAVERVALSFGSRQSRPSPTQGLTTKAWDAFSHGLRAVYARTSNGVPEECVAQPGSTGVDCTTGYVAGTRDVPSTTCPAGCTLYLAIDEIPHAVRARKECTLNNCFGCLGAQLRLCKHSAAKSPFRTGRNCYSAYLGWQDQVLQAGFFAKAGLSPLLSTRRSICSNALNIGKLEVLRSAHERLGLKVHKGDGVDGRPITPTASLLEAYTDRALGSDSTPPARSAVARATGTIVSNK
jgi:hypothetical protein